jgi:hypothetical protein
MIHPTRILLMAAFSLLIALSAQAANIQISAVPFNIVVPGTYVLTANLIYPGILPVNGGLGPPFNGSNAITVNTAASGPVVINLNGHTLSEGAYPSDGRGFH